MMRLILPLLLTLIWAFLPSMCLAWSGQVHTQIGARVYELLDKKERKYYKRLASRLPVDSIEFFNVSAWVDSVRGEPLYELFSKDVPETLFAMRERHTSNWHYHNYFYHGNLQFHGVEKKHPCRMRNKGKLETALVGIDQALQDNTDKKQEAILLAFIMHLLEDLHQPLHTTALVRKDCSHDRGGNLYCLQKMAGRCAMNLHGLWDSAFSVASDQKFMRSITLDSPPQLPFQTDVALMLTQGHDLARKVYDTEENRLPHKSYFDWAKSVTKVQIERSVWRVAHYLKAHYERRNKK